jgi:hypothetical protein
MIPIYRTTATSLHEYRLHYPWTAAVPTLTQNRMLLVLLDRQRQKAWVRGQRRAHWRARMESIRYAIAHPWRALNGEYPAQGAD